MKLPLSGLIQGCNTSPVTVAGKGEGVVVPTVNAAMTAWAQWVNAGNATQAQVDAVKAGYNQYYSSQLVVSNAFTSYFVAVGTTNQSTALVILQTALGTATSSQTNIIYLIAGFTGKTNTP